MSKKKKVELKPIVQDVNEFSVDKNQLLNSVNELKQHTETVKLGSGSDSDSYFRGIVDKMFNDDDISLKTEYLNVNENFAGVKLEFLAKYGAMPYLKDFIKIFETKRVSLERKSRIEMIRALEKREEEIQARQQQNMRSMLGF